MGNQSVNKTNPDPTDQNRWLFYGILFLLPIVLLASLEAGLRLVNYGQSLPLFIAAGKDYPNHLIANPKVSLRYFSEQDNPPQPRHDQFLKHKPSNGYRIFMLGGSTTAAWPYSENMMPSRIIAKRLADAFPEKQIEVVNLAFSAINTYTLLDFVDEITQQSPDAILIYAGHNEFYGALGVGSSKSVADQRWLIRAYLKLQHMRLFMLLKDVIGWFQPSTTDELSLPSGTLMQRMVDEKNIPYNSALYKSGIEQFSENMDEIVAHFKASDVSVVISELVSNIRDHVPFVSTSVEGLDSANEVYQKAQQLEGDGQYQQARELYYRAKDLDALRFRAPEQMNEIIHRLGSKYDVPVVPMTTYFEKNSANGIIGNELMLEHLHPNSTGYFLISEAFLDTMRQADLISNDWPANTVNTTYREEWAITALDHSLAEFSIKKLKDNWPFKSVAQSGKTINNYKPGSAVEALAMDVYYDQIDLVDAHLQLAREFESKADIDSAQREYQAVIEIFPFDQSVYRAAAWSLLKADRVDQALPIIKRSLGVKPTAESYKWLGQIYFRNKDYLKAISNFEQALQLYTKKNPQVVSLLAQSYEKTDQLDKAQRTRDLLEKE